MSASHPLDGDGVNHMLFHYLAKDATTMLAKRRRVAGGVAETDASGHSSDDAASVESPRKGKGRRRPRKGHGDVSSEFLIPDTVVFYNTPTTWYYWDTNAQRCEKKDAKHLEKETLERFFGVPSSRDCEICCTFLVRHAGEPDTVLFLNKEELHTFLYSRPEHHGLLQKFIVPPGDRNFMYQAVWCRRGNQPSSNGSCRVFKRVSRNKLKERTYSDQGLSLKGNPAKEGFLAFAPLARHRLQKHKQFVDKLKGSQELLLSPGTKLSHKDERHKKELLGRLQCVSETKTLLGELGKAAQLCKELSGSFDSRSHHYDKAITFEGASHYAEEKWCHRGISRKIQNTLQRIIDHFEAIDHSHTIARMVAYFKEDEKGKLWLMFSSAIRVQEARSAHHHHHRAFHHAGGPASTNPLAQLPPSDVYHFTGALTPKFKGVFTPDEDEMPSSRSHVAVSAKPKLPPTAGSLFSTKAAAMKLRSSAHQQQAAQPPLSPLSPTGHSQHDTDGASLLPSPRSPRSPRSAVDEPAAAMAAASMTASTMAVAAATADASATEPEAAAPRQRVAGSKGGLRACVRGGEHGVRPLSASGSEGAPPFLCSATSPTRNPVVANTCRVLRKMERNVRRLESAIESERDEGCKGTAAIRNEISWYEASNAELRGTMSRYAARPPPPPPFPSIRLKIRAKKYNQNKKNTDNNNNNNRRQEELKVLDGVVTLQQQDGLPPGFNTARVFANDRCHFERGAVLHMPLRDLHERRRARQLRSAACRAAAAAAVAAAAAAAAAASEALAAYLGAAAHQPASPTGTRKAKGGGCGAGSGAGGHAAPPSVAVAETAQTAPVPDPQIYSVVMASYDERAHMRIVGGRLHTFKSVKAYYKWQGMGERAAEEHWREAACDAPHADVLASASVPADVFEDMMYGIYTEVAVLQHNILSTNPNAAKPTYAHTHPKTKEVVAELGKCFPKDSLFDFPPQVARILVAGEFEPQLRAMKIHPLDPETEAERVLYHYQDVLSKMSRCPGVKAPDLQRMEEDVVAAQSILQSVRRQGTYKAGEGKTPLTCIIHHGFRGTLPEFNKLMASFRSYISAPINREHKMLVKGLKTHVTMARGLRADVKRL